MENIYQAPELVERYEQGQFPDIDTRVQEGQPFSDRFRFIADYIITHVPRHRTLLDAGCANGILGAILQANRPDLRYTGIDTSMPMLASAKDQFTGDLRLAQGNIQHLPIKPNSVQIVVCGSTLWYCSDIPAAVENLYRAANRVFLADLVFLPDREQGVTTTREVDGHRQTVTLLGNQQLQQLLGFINGIQPFKDLRQEKRFIHFPINNQHAGLIDMGDELVQGFSVIFQKRITADFTKIFNKVATERPAEEDEDIEQ